MLFCDGTTDTLLQVRRLSHIMPTYELIMLSIAALLTGWLCFRRWRRARAPLPKTYWTGHGIDITPISKRVQRLRRDFTAELQARPGHACQRGGLLASARKAVARLSYFRKRDAESARQKAHETETNAA